MAMRTLDYIGFKVDTTGNLYTKWLDIFQFVLTKLQFINHVEDRAEPLHESVECRHVGITIVLWIYATITDDLCYVVGSTQQLYLCSVCTE